MDDDFDIFAGIDWATQSHQVCLIDHSGAVLGERCFDHSGAGLAALCDWLIALSGRPPERIAVAIEVPHGAVVESLLERGFAVFSLNPKQLDRFRDRFTMAGAKDDRRDARVAGDALRSDRHCFRRLKIDAPSVIELREWSRMAEQLGQERGRLASRLREQLRRYYPQALELNDDIAANWVLELWKAAPTPQAARRIRPASVSKLLARHRIRKIDGPGALAILRQEPLRVAPGTQEAACAHIRSLIERLGLLNRQIKQANKKLDALCRAIGEQADDDGREKSSGQKPEQRDVTILRSLPGLGRVVLATLLAEASSALRDRNYHALRALSGVAPITRQSGKRAHVVMRRACHRRLRNALYHWARVASQNDPICRARYAALRARGHGHARALRSVADRLLAVACAMLRNNTPFEPNHGQALKNLQASGVTDPQTNPC